MNLLYITVFNLHFEPLSEGSISLLLPFIHQKIHIFRLLQHFALLHPANRGIGCHQPAATRALAEVAIANEVSPVVISMVTDDGFELVPWSRELPRGLGREHGHGRFRARPGCQGMGGGGS